MKIKTKTIKFFDTEDTKKFRKWLIDNDLTMGGLADKLNVSYVYLYVVINGSRALTKKLEEKLAALGFKL